MSGLGLLVRASRVRRLYHVTKTSNLDSILANGIEPRAGIFGENNWQACVFLVRRKPDAEKMVRVFWADHLDGHHTGRFDPDGMTILTVDVNRIYGDGRPRFYADPAVAGLGIKGLITWARIPPRAIIKNEKWEVF